MSDGIGRDDVRPDGIRIIVVDDHTLFRESLARLLEREGEFRVVGLCATVGEARDLLWREMVDVVLLDYDLGDEVGTELLGGPAAGRHGAKVILVTAGMRASAALGAVDSGVAGMVLKHSDPRYLVEAIRAVAEGRTWWDPAMAHAMDPGPEGETQRGGSVRSLTQRQREVLRGILDGLANKEIAARCQASETAIKATIQELFRKAGVRTRSQLVRVAIERYSVDWLMG